MTISTAHHTGLDDNSDPIRVSSTSISKTVAGVIAHRLRAMGAVEVQAIGVGAVYQAVKAITIADTYLQDMHHAGLICTPYFEKVVLDERERTGIRFVIEMRS